MVTFSNEEGISYPRFPVVEHIRKGLLHAVFPLIPECFYLAVVPEEQRLIRHAEELFIGNNLRAPRDFPFPS